MTATREGGVNVYRAAVAVLALSFVGIGIALLAVTAAEGGGVLGFLLGALFVALGVGRLTLLRERRSLWCLRRKLRGFQRVLDAPALFSVAYGEIASSLYFALGIVAAYALGLTPLVLLGGGRLLPDRRALVRRGNGRDPETGGAATFVRRAFNDLWRLRHRLGALPRLPDRDRALGALPAALPRHGPGRRGAARVAVGCRRRRRRDRRDHGESGSSAGRSSTPAGSRSPGSTCARSSCS